MAEELWNKGKIEGNREGNRPSEDDLTREHLGPRGVKGAPDPAKQTKDRDKKTPENLDPGHTA